MNTNDVINLICSKLVGIDRNAVEIVFLSMLGSSLNINIKSSIKIKHPSFLVHLVGESGSGKGTIVEEIYHIVRPKAERIPAATTAALTKKIAKDKDVISILHDAGREMTLMGVASSGRDGLLALKCDFWDGISGSGLITIGRGEEIVGAVHYNEFWDYTQEDFNLVLSNKAAYGGFLYRLIPVQVNPIVNWIPDIALENVRVDYTGIMDRIDKIRLLDYSMMPTDDFKARVISLLSDENRHVQSDRGALNRIIENAIALAVTRDIFDNINENGTTNARVVDFDNFEYFERYLTICSSYYSKVTDIQSNTSENKELGKFLRYYNAHAKAGVSGVSKSDVMRNTGLTASQITEIIETLPHREDFRVVRKTSSTKTGMYFCKGGCEYCNVNCDQTTDEASDDEVLQ